MTPENRMRLIRDLYRDEPRIEVRIYTELTGAFCRELGIKTLFVSNAAGGMNPDYSNHKGFLHNLQAVGIYNHTQKRKSANEVCNRETQRRRRKFQSHPFRQDPARRQSDPTAQDRARFPSVAPAVIFRI